MTAISVNYCESSAKMLTRVRVPFYKISEAEAQLPHRDSFNGVRLYMNGMKLLADAAPVVNAIPTPTKGSSND